MQPRRLDIRRARSDDAGAIADIYNQAILARNATFETEPRTREERLAWLAEHDAHHAVLVAEEDGRILGWASTSIYRPRRCYDGVGEVSVYIHHEARGRGLGVQLMNALIAEAEQSGLYKLVARIFAFNEASRAMCRKCGFREVGIYEKHGQLDGRWIDCVILERLIPTNIKALAQKSGA